MFVCSHNYFLHVWYEIASFPGEGGEGETDIFYLRVMSKVDATLSHRGG